MKTKEEYLKEVRNISEEYFRKGEFFCSEAVLQTINDALGQPLSPEITKLASGFPIGLGKAQCLCGAISGGEMALGIVYGRVPERKEHCIKITGQVTEWVADKLIEDEKLNIK